MVDLDAARLQSVGNIGGTGYYYTNVICVFAMANFVLQLCKTRYLENWQETWKVRKCFMPFIMASMESLLESLALVVSSIKYWGRI